MTPCIMRSRGCSMNSSGNSSSSGFSIHIHSVSRAWLSRAIFAEPAFCLAGPLLALSAVAILALCWNVLFLYHALYYARLVSKENLPLMQKQTLGPGDRSFMKMCSCYIKIQRTCLCHWRLLGSRLSRRPSRIPNNFSINTWQIYVFLHGAWVLYIKSLLQRAICIAT